LACRGDKECKYWLDSENIALIEAYVYGLSSRDAREVKKLIFENFDYIETKWREFQEKK